VTLAVSLPREAWEGRLAIACAIAIRGVGALSSELTIFWIT
jgi:hypothetical protein